MACTTAIPPLTGFSVVPNINMPDSEYCAAVLTYYSELGTFITQSNTLAVWIKTTAETACTAKDEAQTTATNAANSALEAKAARDEAVNAVAVLPDGTINDSILSPVDAWSSQKISDELAKKVNILDMDELTQDIIGNSIIGSSGILISYDDNTGDTTISFSGSSGYSNMRVFNTSGIFDISTAKGAGRYFVEVVGASGLNGLFGGNSGGGGGGGGGYVFGFADITANVTVTIAAHGYGGGITSFGGFCSALGGYSGGDGSYSGLATGGAGGMGGTATVGSGFAGKALQGHDGGYGESGGSLS